MDFQKIVISNTEPDRKAKVWARPTKDSIDLLILDSGKWKPVMSEDILRKIMEDIGTATEIIEGDTPSYSDMQYGKMYLNEENDAIFVPINEPGASAYKVLEFTEDGLYINEKNGSTTQRTKLSPRLTDLTPEERATLKGDKGDKGDQGDSAIWTGEGEPWSGLKNTTGQSTTEPMTQKAVTEELQNISGIIGGNGISNVVWTDNRSINPSGGSLQYSADTIASSTLFKINDKCTNFTIGYRGISTNTVLFNAGFFDSERVYISRMSSYPNAGTLVEVPQNAKYIKICLALRDGNTSIGGDQSDYDLENIYIDYDNTIYYLIKENERKTQGNADDIDTLEEDVQRIAGQLGNKVKGDKCSFVDGRGLSPDNGGAIVSTSILCTEYFNIGESDIVSFAYSDVSENILNICVAWYDDKKTFIRRDNWHYISVRNYNTRPENAQYFRFALGLWDKTHTNNLSGEQENYTLINLEVKYDIYNTLDTIEDAVSQNTEDIQELQNLIGNHDVKYDGKPVVIRPKLGYELLAISTHASALQGGAAWGDYYFQFHGQNNKNGQGVANLFYGIEIFNLSSKTKIQEILLGFDILKHNNSASFSNQYYDVSDQFPLLYVSQEDASARYVTVYRVEGEPGAFTITMVQVIYLPPTSEGANYYYPNCFVDLTARKIVFSGFSNTDNTKFTFEEWELPLCTSGDTVQLGTVTMQDGGDGNPIQVQGFTLPNGNVVRRNDNDSATSIKVVGLEENAAIKTFHISKVNPYTGNVATTQGGCMFGGKVYQSFGSANNSILRVVDVESENVETTINLTEIENAEPEAVFIHDDCLGFAVNSTGKIIKLRT